jgi:(4-O-methyl)-D-glucuronate---lignin esterase
MLHAVIVLLAVLLVSAPFTMAAELPDPFLFNDGARRVKTPQDWDARRAELLELFAANEYGHLPPPPAKMTFLPLQAHTYKPLAAPHRQFKVICDPGEGGEKISLVVDLILPPKGNGPFPVIVRGDWCWGKLSDDITRKILDRGYALVDFNRCELAPDLGVKQGDQTVALYASYPGGDFGSIAAWAWGFHRCVDLLVTLPQIDKEKIAITGHSRGGKAALLAGASDSRIALTAPNNSGCGGAGCFRFVGPDGERIENITGTFPQWFTPRFRDYIGKDDQLPIDQHELKALVAPRALLTTEALGDLHANPSGTLITHRAAREVYAFLGHPERIGIHFRPGGHEHNADDFVVLLDFADEVFFHKGSHDWNPNPFPELPQAYSWRAPIPPATGASARD